jgi:hypothetical protein
MRAHSARRSAMGAVGRVLLGDVVDAIKHDVAARVAVRRKIRPRFRVVHIVRNDCAADQ